MSRMSLSCVNLVWHRPTPPFPRETLFSARLQWAGQNRTNDFSRQTGQTSEFVATQNNWEWDLKSSLSLFLFFSLHMGWHEPHSHYVVERVEKWKFNYLLVLECISFSTTALHFLSDFIRMILGSQIRLGLLSSSVLQVSAFFDSFRIFRVQLRGAITV